MVKITLDGNVSYTDNPIYIRKSANGSFVPCSSADATGIAISSTPYHIVGRDELEGAVGDVEVEEIDAGELLTALLARVNTQEGT